VELLTKLGQVIIRSAISAVGGRTSLFKKVVWQLAVEGLLLAVKALIEKMREMKKVKKAACAERIS